MSLLTQLFLAERYGLRMDLEQIAKELGTTPQNLRRRISGGTFEIPTYVDGTKRWADIRDVAAYFDQQRAHANPRAGDWHTA